MSPIQKEILKCMSDLKAAGESLQARFSFPKEFVGFQGHFKDNPVLPGICKIQAVLAMYESFYNKPFRLSEVSLAKYFLPVTFDETVTVQCDLKSPEGLFSIKAALHRDEAKVAMLQLVLEGAES